MPTAPIIEDRYYAARDNALTIVRPWSVEYRTVNLDIVHTAGPGTCPDDAMSKSAFRRDFILINPQAPMDGAKYYTIDLCTCCYIALVNGEPCQCGDDTDQHPDGLMGRLAGEEITAGLLAQEHNDTCPINIYGTAGINFPADSFECDCERTNFAQFSCDGCGSYLAGSREKATGWVKGKANSDG